MNYYICEDDDDDPRSVLDSIGLTREKMREMLKGQLLENADVSFESRSPLDAVRCQLLGLMKACLKAGEVDGDFLVFGAAVSKLVHDFNEGKTDEALVKLIVPGKVMRERPEGG